MKHKAFGFLAIDFVTNYRCAKTLGVGSVDTQLMRAACNGVEAYACATFGVALNLKQGVCRTAIGSDHLSWAVVIVEL